MSRKNRDPNEVAARKVKKALRNTPVGYIDLIDYVRTRTRCTAGMARKVLLAGALMVDSHPVGYKWRNDPLTGDAIKVLDPYLEAKHRPNIIVQWNKMKAEGAKA